MSAMANTTPIVATVTKPATKERMPKDADTTPKVSIQDFCEEHYKDILLVIMDKICRDKRKKTAPVMRKEEGKVNPCYLAYRRAAPVMKDTRSQSQKGDPEDHVKKFQAAAQVERWAMPTWCHMFNSTLIWAARVWFDELPPESIDRYKDLKAAFLAYFIVAYHIS
ncbi:hypothetical protein Tco_1434029 [Tanacetum coccineum]